MKDFKTCMKGLWDMSKPALGRTSVTVLVGIVRVCASISFVMICRRLVDIATGDLDADLTRIILAFIGIILVQISCGLFSNYWENLNVVKTQNQQRLKTFDHVLKSRWNGREAFRSGDTVNRLEEDIRVLIDLVCSRMPEVVVTLVQLLVASYYMLHMDSSLYWVLIILMLVAVFGSKMFFSKLRKLTSDIRAKDSEIQQLMQENLQNRVLVLTLVGVGRVVQRMGNLQDLLKRDVVTRLNYNLVARGFMNIGFMGGYAAAFLWGVLGIKSGAVSFGMMTAFLQLVGQIQRPVADLGRQIPAFIKAMTSVERLLELEDLPEEEKGDDVQFSGAPGIKAENITFAYKDTDILKNFSHDFKPGSMTVIAGPTGIGKSTLSRLMLGLLSPSEGEVSLYEGEVSHPAGADTRCNFMYVPQGNSLMSGTIRENMRLAAPEATDEEILDALHTAVADFVTGLKDGLDTVCGESGTGLSEGQCQRIAIARALLRKGGVMILDEATSALDPETETKLLDNISKRYKGGKTVIFISHRPAASRIADDVINL